MQATLSADGQYRVELRITVRAGIGELANVLASAYSNHRDEDGPLPTLSVKATQAAIRTEITARGEMNDGWGDDLGNAEINRRLAWAERQVRRAYPELVLVKAEPARLAPLANRQKADPETVAEIHAARCRDCKGAGCPVCGYSGRDANRKIADAGRLSLEEALEYADQMRRDTTVVGLPNWPEPAPHRREDVRRQNNARRAASGLPVATCIHGNTPRADVTGDPITACANARGADWGAFNAEGCTYRYDCAVDVANQSAAENEEAEATPEDPESRWGEMCRDHDGEPKSTCEKCFAETDEDDEQDDEDEYDE